MVQQIESKDLIKTYNRRNVVNGVSLAVRKGEIVGLLGPNGAGKTTIFYMIVGMIRANKGEIYADQHRITRWPMYRRAKLGIGYLPQETSIFRKMTVEQNLYAILETLPMSRKERKERQERLLSDLRVGHLRHQLGLNLSGGERRRVEIARALVTDPDFMLLDEPFAGVDPISVEDIQSIVADLKKRNIGILITDHNVRETLAITDRAYIIANGKILKSGTSEYLANDPEARKIYLGQKFKLD